MNEHQVASPQQWLLARKSCSKRGRRSPRTSMSSPKPAGRCPGARRKAVRFRGPSGPESLADLSRSLAAGRLSFHVWTERRGRLQELLVLGPTTSTARAAFGRARRDARRRLARSVEQARGVQEAVGGSFKWLSSGMNTVQRRSGVAFRDEESRGRQHDYNYAPLAKGPSDCTASACLQGRERSRLPHLLHLWRGLDMLNGTYHYLDLVPKGPRRRRPALPQRLAEVSR